MCIGGGQGIAAVFERMGTDDTDDEDGAVGTAEDSDEGTGENLCPDCAGRGQIEDRTCPTCHGSGTVTEPIGGA